MVLDTTSGSRSVLGRARAAISLREYMVTYKYPAT